MAMRVHRTTLISAPVARVAEVIAQDMLRSRTGALEWVSASTFQFSQRSVVAFGASGTIRLTPEGGATRLVLDAALDVMQLGRALRAGVGGALRALSPEWLQSIISLAEMPPGDDEESAA